MEWIRNWAVSISMVVIFGTLVEFIMPNGNYRKYIHLVLALLLMITISNPIIKLVNGDFVFDRYDFNVGDSSRVMDSEEYEKRQESHVIRVYTKSLENNISATIEENIPVLTEKCQVRVDTQNSVNDFGKVLGVAIIIDDSVTFADEQAENEMREKLTEIISASMGIGKDKVTVVI